MTFFPENNCTSKNLVKEGNAYVFYTKYLHGDKDRFRGSLKKGILKKGWEGGERGL